MQLFDAQFSRKPMDDMQKLVSSYSPDVVGISASTAQIQAAFDMASAIKRLNPSIILS